MFLIGVIWLVMMIVNFITDGVKDPSALACLVASQVWLVGSILKGK